ncbi:MAG: bifunctional folylpolyglutamate synthase/dihydrofolate synthase [Crocinitomicaceae bacterium]|nr:bifunctional folylpolyglutamate synthase/dihydrofolate synthase [Crocinitomicaceae bacterium]MBK8926119.1 bifunctional folylpolyglutamate synthase/dihydrofolate synthase [Crocinitomicaceae bacterium]
MTYSETLTWLFSQLPNYQLQGQSAYKPGLENIKKLVELTGSEILQSRFFHVAGTNGKGSVCNMLASIMMEHGYKTGLFTSPHLHDFRERIRINGKMISEEFVTVFVEQNKQAWAEIKPSFFEITTVMALSAFKQAKCDICIMETGLGGRLDSTNIITPEISIITNIGLDHTQFLGDSTEQIAYEKAGIIKKNIPVVIGECTHETKPVFERAASLNDAPIYFAGLVSGFVSDLKGNFQQKNIATVMKSIEVLRAKGWNFMPKKIRDGFQHVTKNTNFTGRFQKLQDNPAVIVDAAHNEDGVKTLFAEIMQVKFDKLHLIYGAANDKDVRNIFKLFPKDALYYFTEFDSKRSLLVDDFISLAKEFKLNADFYSSSADAVAAAYETAGENDLILVFGSFYLVQEILPKKN